MHISAFLPILFFLKVTSRSILLSSYSLVGIAMKDADHPCIFSHGGFYCPMAFWKRGKSLVCLCITLNAVRKRDKKQDIHVTHSSQNGEDIWYWHDKPKKLYSFDFHE